MFDILLHRDWGPGGGDPVAGAVVLDVFCGTGALGLEALSRGASSVWMMDAAPQSLALARRNVAGLGEEGSVTVMRADGGAPPRARTAAMLAFLDPPYGQDLAAPALAALAATGWLAAGCVAVVELARRDRFAVPPGFELLDDRQYGETRVVFLRFAPAPD